MSIYGVASKTILDPLLNVVISDQVDEEIARLRAVKVW